MSGLQATAGDPPCPVCGRVLALTTLAASGERFCSPACRRRFAGQRLKRYAGLAALVALTDLPEWRR